MLFLSIAICLVATGSATSAVFGYLRDKRLNRMQKQIDMLTAVAADKTPLLLSERTDTDTGLRLARGSNYDLAAVDAALEKCPYSSRYETFKRLKPHWLGATLEEITPIIDHLPASQVDDAFRYFAKASSKGLYVAR